MVGEHVAYSEDESVIIIYPEGEVVNLISCI